MLTHGISSQQVADCLFSEHVFHTFLNKFVTNEVLRARRVSVEVASEGGQGRHATQGAAAKRERGAGSRHVC